MRRRVRKKVIKRLKLRSAELMKQIDNPPHLGDWSGWAPWQEFRRVVSKLNALRAYV